VPDPSADLGHCLRLAWRRHRLRQELEVHQHRDRLEVLVEAGVAPIPANSGQVTTRYRINRYGDRQLNNALHTVVQSRIQYQQATRDYIARRTAEGKTPREIKRCLARYVARDLYRLLENEPAAA
jgi:hypothetical protein